MGSFTIKAFEAAGFGSSEALLDRIFREVTDMFEGRFPGYRAIDMQYHDYEHTLQATVCMVQILEGQRRSRDIPVLSQRDWELAVLIVMLHDTGYLKRSSDTTGTGAKYTLIHVVRSCEFARAYLPGLGLKTAEIEEVQSAISCTGPMNHIPNMHFRRPVVSLLASMLVTADYLGQLGAADYVEELPILFDEFREAYEHDKIPHEKWMFKSKQNLLQKTPDFWVKYVRPLLDNEAASVHRYLQKPDGTNPYFDAIEANMVRVRAMIASGAGVA